GEEPPEPVGTAMAAADLVLLATTYSLTHTHARRSANRAGARVISMPGIEEGMLRQGGLATDWAKIHEVVRRTARRLRGAREVHLTSAAGTDLSFSLEGRDWISGDTGLCTRKGTVTTLPAGELFIAVVEGSASGRLVVDVHLEERLRGPASAQIVAGTASRNLAAQAAVVQHAVEAVLLRGLLEPPEDRELVPALLALVVLAQVPAGDVEPVPLDRDRAAARTVRVLETMARDVPDVDVLQALLLRDRAVLLERLDGSPGELHHLVVRMEPEEMDWRVR